MMRNDTSEYIAAIEETFRRSKNEYGSKVKVLDILYMCVLIKSTINMDVYYGYGEMDYCLMIPINPYYKRGTKKEVITDFADCFVRFAYSLSAEAAANAIGLYYCDEDEKWIPKYFCENVWKEVCEHSLQTIKKLADDFSAACSIPD